MSIKILKKRKKRCESSKILISAPMANIWVKLAYPMWKYTISQCRKSSRRAEWADALVQQCHQGPERLLSHCSAVPIINFMPKLAPLKTQNDGHRQLRLHASFCHSTKKTVKKQHWWYGSEQSCLPEVLSKHFLELHWWFRPVRPKQVFAMGEWNDHDWIR